MAYSQTLGNIAQRQLSVHADILDERQKEKIQ